VHRAGLGFLMGPLCVAQIAAVLAAVIAALKLI
jgi:hypothetical protein